jgi:hypothetical protein
LVNPLSRIYKRGFAADLDTGSSLLDAGIQMEAFQTEGARNEPACKSTDAWFFVRLSRIENPASRIVALAGLWFL